MKINNSYQYTFFIKRKEVEKIKEWCQSKLLKIISSSSNYIDFFAKKKGLVITLYNNGTLLIQGKYAKNTLKELSNHSFYKKLLNKRKVCSNQKNNFPYQKISKNCFYAGLDESGKGDLFGPLVTACVIANKSIVKKWIKLGIKDSKKYSSDSTILKLSNEIINTKGIVVKTLYFSMRKYNEFYIKLNSNLNNLLAWMHSETLKKSLKIKKIQLGILDQFSKKPLVQNFLGKKDFKLFMQTKADELDLIVAAASIIARSEYIKQLHFLKKKFRINFVKGSGLKAKFCLRKILRIKNEGFLKKVAKIHFRTIKQVMI
jgi:ribonuclease HIII